MEIESDRFEDEMACLWIEDGIIHFLYKQDAVVDLIVQKRHIENRIRIGKGIKMPMFSDVRLGKYWTREAKKYSFQNFQGVSALAFLIKESPIHRIIINSALMTFKSPVPIRAFTNKEKAMEWLKKFKESDKDKNFTKVSYII